MVQVIYNVYLEQEDVVGKTIPGFYGIIAEAIGLSWGDEGLKADCRRMTVSEKIREEIFATYRQKAVEKFGVVTDAAESEIGMAWVMCGPKVDTSLDVWQVQVFPGAFEYEDVKPTAYMAKSGYWISRDEAKLAAGFYELTQCVGELREYIAAELGINNDEGYRLWEYVTDATLDRGQDTLCWDGETWVVDRRKRYFDVVCDAFEDIAYALYKQSWMSERSYTQEDADAIEDLEEVGFPGGELWACFDEFMGAEMEDKEFMLGILPEPLAKFFLESYGTKW